MHAFRTTCILGAALLASACTTLPKDASMDTGQFLPRELVVDGTAHRYQVFVPSRTAGGTHPPIILFLHGTGERGSDGEKQVKVGIGPYVRQHTADFPAIVVFAQAPDDQDWMGPTAQLAIDELDAASREFHADPKRTYLTGLSMGGYGTWEVALMQPDRFAALVPICGALTPPSDERSLYVTELAGVADPYATLAQRLKHVPIWIFHGARDDLVPLADDRKTYAALKAAGADARYTEFPDANHNAWDPAYSQTPELWTWLFAQKKR
jgi:predicted peptidase